MYYVYYDYTSFCSYGSLLHIICLSHTTCLLRTIGLFSSVENIDFKKIRLSVLIGVVVIIFNTIMTVIQCMNINFEIKTRDQETVPFCSIMGNVLFKFVSCA